MASHAAPVPEGTPVVVHLVDGDARRWVDPGDPHVSTEDDGTPSTVPCTLYKRGHRVHFIQAKAGLGTPSTTYTLLAVVGNELLVAGDDNDLSHWWAHDTEFARAALLLDEQPVVHLHGYGLARIGSTLFCPYVPGADGRLEPCAWNPPSDLQANGGGFL